MEPLPNQGQPELERIPLTTAVLLSENAVNLQVTSAKP